MKQIVFLFVILGLFLVAGCVPEDGAGAGEAVKRIKKETKTAPSPLVVTSSSSSTDTATATAPQKSGPKPASPQLATAPNTEQKPTVGPSEELLLKNDFSYSSNQFTSLVSNPPWEISLGRMGYFLPEAGSPSVMSQLEYGGIVYSTGAVVFSPTILQQKVAVYGGEKYLVSITAKSEKQNNFFGIAQYDINGNLIPTTLDAIEMCGGQSKIVDGMYRCSLDVSPYEKVEQPSATWQPITREMTFTTNKNTALVAVFFGNEDILPGGKLQNSVMTVQKISLYGPKMKQTFHPEAKVTAYVKRGEFATLDNVAQQDVNNRPVYTLFVQADAAYVPIEHVRVYNPEKGRVRYYSCASKSCTVKDTKWPSLFKGDKAKGQWEFIDSYSDGSYDYPEYYLAKPENWGDICSLDACTNDKIKVELFFANGATETITLDKGNNFYFEGDARKDVSTATMPKELSTPIDHNTFWQGTFSNGCSCVEPTVTLAPAQYTVQAVQTTTATTCPTYEPIVKTIASNKAECTCVEKS